MNVDVQPCAAQGFARFISKISPCQHGLFIRKHFKLPHFVTRNGVPGRGMSFRDTMLRQFEIPLFHRHIALKPILLL
jgi:hypothetical protein